jgi:hypothetical protein
MQIISCCPLILISVAIARTTPYIYHNHTDMASTARQVFESILLSIGIYEGKSQRHADLKIKVQQHGFTHGGPGTYNVLASFRIQVSFESVGLNSGSVMTTCRPQYVAGSPTGLIQAKRGGHYITLRQFLRKTFPVKEAPLDLDLLIWDWSKEEDVKPFNWFGLPVELKEMVIEHCMHQSPDRTVCSAALSYYSARSGVDMELGPYEVTQQLGDWSDLLRVSKQVRAIALRLCLRGSTSLDLGCGLCIDAASYKSFHECIERLGSHYQVVDDDSVPVDERTRALAQQYDRFPKIYPELSRYATMRHGIQKMCLKMDFLDYMNFFKVTSGGFERYQNHNLMTYEILEQFPRLNEIILRLPLRPGRGWKNDPRRFGPLLFHFVYPCPRQLHRVIYERAAEVLALYKSVRVLNFVDENEESRFESLHQAATGEPVQAEDGFFPPECRCPIACVNEPVFLRRY